MVKLFHIFIMALCLTQNFPRNLAGLEEEEDEIEAKFKTLKYKFSDRFLDLSQKLINLDEKYIKLITKTNISLTRIFKFAKVKIADIIDHSAVAEECSIIAYEEFDKIDEKIKTDITNCIGKGIKRTSKVIDELENNILNTRILISEEFNVKTSKCLQKFKLDGPLLSNCLDDQERMKMMIKMDEAELTAAENSMLILEQITEDVGRCLKEVNIDALMNTGYVTDEFKTCNNKENI